ncbi:MAG: FAD-binding oxidoreductase [Cycloclasticus sp.]|nr:FAD-binding oxidoreductase [Cycloclasticus sp.]
MPSKKHIDFLIIGQGLAGSLLGWQLIQQGKHILIADPCLQQTTSRTAAGLINPITGKRLVKTNGLEHYLPSAKKLYQSLSEFFKQPFLHPLKQVRVFKSNDEVLQWEKRQQQADYAPFLGSRLDPSTKDYLRQNTIGGFEQKQCAYLDTVPLLDQLRHFFLQQGCFISSKIDPKALTLTRNAIEWGDYQISKVIFCDGYQLKDNPWFSWLPLQPAQGEIFTLETDQPLPKEMVQFGKWLLPLANGQFKLGATWQWSPLNELSCDTSVDELLNACHQQFSHLKNARLIKKNVGIRPGTRDKQPFIGQHPYHAQLFVFNGFGSKGSLIIPWCSERFADYLLNNKALPDTLDIKRYANGCPAG